MNTDVTPEIDWLKKWALHSPHHTALSEYLTEKKVTYKEFYKASQVLAQKLKNDFGILFGDRVSVLSTNEFEYVILFYALQRLGAIMVPINFRLTSSEVKHILEDCSPKLMVYQNEFEKTLSDASKDLEKLLKWSMEDLQSFYSNQDFKNSDANLDFDSKINFSTPCMIMYTSGTTGAPKGAIITQGMMFWNSINTTLRLNISQNDKTLIFMPFFHTGGWNVLTTPFFHRGAHIILLKKFDAQKALEITEKEKLTIFFGVPTMMQMIAETKEFNTTNLTSLRYAVVGGEPSAINLIKTWNSKGVPFRQGYGLTEFGPNVFSLNHEDAEKKIGSIGFANFYIDVKVVDVHGKPCSHNEVGELCLKGPMCMAGYWNHPKATAEAIIDGWLHTGDLVKFDSEGYFYVVGRKKDMFISGGENVYPAEVEKVLLQHPAVKEAAVIGVKDPKWGEVGKAFIVKKQEISDLALKDHCTSNLAKFKVPKHYEFINALPKSESGKILKRTLL